MLNEDVFNLTIISNYINKCERIFGHTMTVSKFEEHRRKEGRKEEHQPMFEDRK